MKHLTSTVPTGSGRLGSGADLDTQLQHATTETLVGALLLLVGVAVAISIAFYVAMRIAMWLDTRSGGSL